MIEKNCNFCNSKFLADSRKLYPYCSSLCRSKDKFIEIEKKGKKIRVWKLNYNKYTDFYESDEFENRYFNKCYVCGNVYKAFRMCCSSKCSNIMKEETTFRTTGAKHNLSRNSISRSNMEDRLMENYGIINVYQRDDVKRKLKETWYLKYGFDNPSKSDLIKKKKRDKLETQGYWIPREKWDDRKIYENNVHEITWSQMKKYGRVKFGNDIWDRIRESRNLSQKDWLTVDHRFSRLEGFSKKISPAIIGHICNLDVISFQENRKKWSDSSIEYEELLKEIEIFNKSINE
jgi:hypothetical protein